MTDDNPSAPAALAKSDEDTANEQKLRKRAHQLWQLEGEPEGGAEQFWHRAAELIDDEAQSSYPPKQARGNRY